ncbi:hypothetical protein CDD83_8060 [Cordyceps sp. RAO-2017]|nr:hypothetical protein CDD83_8060 [Cordyceps sp. RAO-2017]
MVTHTSRIGTGLERPKRDKVTCPDLSRFNDKYIAIWAKAENQSPKALLCQPFFYKQSVTANIGVEDARPLDGSLLPLSGKQPLSSSEFNRRSFIHAALLWPLQNDGARRYLDLPDDLLKSRYNLTGLPKSSKLELNHMVALALSTTGGTVSLDAFSDPRALETVFTRAYQQLFSLCVSHFLANGTIVTGDQAVYTYPMNAIVVSRLFSALLESLPLLMAGSSATILYLCHNVQSNLRSNPNSMSRLIEKCPANSIQKLGMLSRLDHVHRKMLFKCLQNETFRLSSVDKLIQDDVEARLQNADQDVNQSEPFFKPAYPFALTRNAGFSFLGILLGAITFLTWLHIKEITCNGIPRPSENFETRQILEHFIPSIFATLIGILWVWLNRLLCCILPFHELGKGKARPAWSIDITYTAMLPQLNAWRAFKARHFVLSIVCLTALLSNPLGIGMAALFHEETITVPGPQEFRPLLVPELTNGSDMYQKISTKCHSMDEFFIAESTMSHKTRLQPWVTPAYFFLPHEVIGHEFHHADDTYIVQTQGLGADLNCTPNVAYSEPLQDSDLDEALHWPAHHEIENHCLHGISDVTHQALLSLRYLYREAAPSEHDMSTSQNWMYLLANHKDSQLNSDCESAFFVAWARLSGPKPRESKTFNMSLAFCIPVFEAASFNVSVDMNGNILSYSKTGEMGSPSGFTYNKTVVNDMLAVITHRFSTRDLSALGVSWPSHGEATNYLTYLSTLPPKYSNSSLDPNQPIPDAARMISDIKDVYRRVFAIVLGLSHDGLFNRANSTELTKGTRLVKETRIFMDPFAQKLTLVLLSINVLVALILYIRGFVCVLPRLPNSIGSVLAYIAPSNMVATGSLPLERGQTVSFGRYVGADGVAHVGIDVDPFVVPIDPSSLKETGLFHRLTSLWIPGKTRQTKARFRPWL